MNFAYQPTLNRKVQKRSHTLRYVLKNRATDEVLFVVLFTLYLKDDVDEEGNVKPGVMEDANKPFELRDEEAKDRHGKGKKGWGWWGGGDGADEDEDEEAEDTGSSKIETPQSGKVENGKVVEATNDDDVD